MNPSDHLVPIRNDEIFLHVRRWPGERPEFVLLHGLSSNCRTWDAVANHLAEAGHAVTSVDQRGHGLSDKPDDGYGFASVSEDLKLLLDTLNIRRPIVAGQSWGGNVVLDFAARYPNRALGIAFVDGGVLDLQSQPGGDWESIEKTLEPPSLVGIPRQDLKSMISLHHPEWSDAGIEATLGNFENLADGTVRPWLTLDRHMRILRQLWEQRPGDLYPLIQQPVLICAADEGGDASWTVAKHRMVASAQQALPHSAAEWFHETAHDIHVHRPRELADLFLFHIEDGIWSDEGRAVP
jgi:pimeloyl-ACP methyl ester carboxylesterase